MGLTFACGKESMKGLHKVSTVRDEMVIKVHQSEEAAKLAGG